MKRKYYRYQHEEEMYSTYIILNILVLRDQRKYWICLPGSGKGPRRAWRQPGRKTEAGEEGRHRDCPAPPCGSWKGGRIHVRPMFQPRPLRGSPVGLCSILLAHPPILGLLRHQCQASVLHRQHLVLLKLANLLSKQVNISRLRGNFSNCVKLMRINLNW